MTRGLLAAYLSALFLIGLYFGIGGMGQVEYNDRIQELALKVENDSVKVVYDGHVWNNATEVKRVIIYEEQQLFITLFPWVEQIPDIVSLLLTSCAFCLLGSIISIIRRILFQPPKPNTTFLLLYPILGIITGPVILAINYLLPTILASGAENIRPIPLMFLSLIAGLFLEVFYNKVTSVATNKLFKE